MIYQYIQTWNKGDAVGNEVRAISRYLHKCGIENLVVKSQPVHAQAGTVLFDEFESMVKEDDLLLFHLAWITPDLIWRKLKAFPCKKIIIYHNITPGEFFAPYDKLASKTAVKARQQLQEGARIFDAAWADSRYNADELVELGYKNVSEMPLLIAFDDYKQEADQMLIDSLSDGYTNILFVGRMVPNKCLEDIISAFAEYKERYNERSRLILVGNDDMKLYVNKLHNFCRDNHLKDVVFRAHCPFADILAYYRSAKLFLCMSEHEGFCVPLLESMVFQVPVLAYSACAVPATLGDGGICFTDKDPAKVAALMHAVLSDDSLIAEIRAKQKEQLDHFDPEKILPQMLDSLKTFQNQ